MRKSAVTVLAGLMLMQNAYVEQTLAVDQGCIPAEQVEPVDYEKSCDTYLREAVRKNNIELAKELLNTRQVSANPTHNNYCDKADCIIPPLMGAIQTGNAEMVELLLQHGAIVDADNRFGYPLNYTISHFTRTPERTKILELLFQYGADVNHKVPKDGNTPLMIVARDWFTNNVVGQTKEAKQRYEQLMTLLVEHGARIDDKNNNGMTALLLASSSDATEFLLNKGANIEAEDNGGARAITWAAKSIDIDRVQLLLDKGVELNFLIQPGHFAKGFEVSHKLCDEENGMKWFYAILIPPVLLNPGFYLYGPICHLKVGNDSKKHFPHGYTTLDLAYEIGRKDLAKLLEKHGAKPVSQILKKQKSQARQKP